MLDKRLAELKAHEVFIYGFGAYGKCVFDTYFSDSPIQVLHFIDKDTTKKGKVYGGAGIILPDEIVSDHTNAPIIITPKDFADEICDELLSLGISADRLVRLPWKTVNYSIVNADEYFDCANELDYVGSMPVSPRITVFACFYNKPPRLIRRSIESVLSQTYSNFVYRIIDNGSTGETTEIIREYADRDARIIVERYNHNIHYDNLEGSAAMLYKAISTFNTEYFCVLDNDDYYDETFLEETLSLAEMHGADIVKVQTLGINVLGNGVVKYPVPTWWQTRAVDQNEFRKMVISGWGYYAFWATLIRVETLKKELEPELLWLDYYIVINAIMHSTVAIRIDKVLHYQTQDRAISTANELRSNPKHKIAIAEAVLIRATMLLGWVAPVMAFEQYTSFVLNDCGLRWICLHKEDFLDAKSEKIIRLITKLFGIIDKEPYRSLVATDPYISSELKAIQERLLNKAERGLML